MRFFCLFLFFLTFSNAQIMMTFDSQTNAKLSRSNEQLSDMLYKLNEAFKNLSKRAFQQPGST